MTTEQSVGDVALVEDSGRVALVEFLQLFDAALLDAAALAAPLVITTEVRVAERFL